MNLEPTPELTVQALVAIISANGWQTLDQGRDFPWLLASKPTASDRFRRVLDALACLCVSSPGGQVFSIGLQIDHPNSQLVITVADNQEVKQDTIDYLTGIWGILKRLSDLNTGKQSDSEPSCMVSWKTPVSNSPEMLRLKAAILSQDLVKLVYVFTTDKRMRQIRKWWNPEEQPQLKQQHEQGLLPFARTFQEKLGRFLHGKEGKLELLIAHLRAAVIVLQGKAVNWAMVTTYMNRATNLADAVLGGDDPHWCESIALSLASDPKNPFPLRRAINKLTSQHRHLRELLSFSRSRRLRLAFSLSTTFHAVPTPTPRDHILLPDSIASWQALLNQVCAEHHHVLHSDLATPLLGTLLTHYNSPTSTHRVHSECALVAHYEMLRASHIRYVPPFSYVGVSKPSCKPCHMWLSAFNTRMAGPRFHTRGFSERWNFPWTPPEVNGWKPALKEDMGRVCLENLAMMGVLRSVSDGAVSFKWERDLEENVMRRLVEESLVDDF